MWQAWLVVAIGCYLLRPCSQAAGLLPWLVAALQTCSAPNAYLCVCPAVQGFGWLAWLVVALQVFGGLIVGMVVKYADNILKNFANALSVIFTVIGAMPLFGQYPSIFFLFGVIMVLLSVFMYGKSAQVGPKHCPAGRLLWAVTCLGKVLSASAELLGSSSSIPGFSGYGAPGGRHLWQKRTWCPDTAHVLIWGLN